MESWEGSNEFLRLFLEGRVVRKSGFRFYEENECSFIDKIIEYFIYFDSAAVYDHFDLSDSWVDHLLLHFYI